MYIYDKSREILKERGRGRETWYIGEEMDEFLDPCLI
jgi:hypothetical protein